MTAPYTGENRRLIQRAGDEATERVWADRRMQEQLAKVTAERDELLRIVERYVALGDPTRSGLYRAATAAVVKFGGSL